MRISPISLRAFSPTSFRSQHIDSLRQGPVDPVPPVRPVADTMSTRNLMWESGRLSGSTMRRALMAAWLHGRPGPGVMSSQQAIIPATRFSR